jgi:hypothetical protein
VPTLRRDLLQIYLNDHLAIATGAAALARRTAAAQDGTPAGAELAELVTVIETDRTELLAVFARLGVRRTRYKESLAVVGERLGRFKLNGAIRQRSPLSSLVELDGLTVAVTGTRTCWQTLRSLADADPALDSDHLDGALARTGDVLTRLDGLRAATVRDALRPAA